MSVSLHLRGRVCGQDERYRPLAETGLHGAFAQTGGAGTLADPALYTVTLRNESGAPWQGVVLAELAFPHKEPRFFLPGFLYGRNRGEAPLRVDNRFPRLRRGAPQLPASPFWMVRGDRLSHPAAFALDGGRLYGLSAGPYLVNTQDGRRLWEPGVNGTLCGYAGFTCSLEEGTLGHTIGYENAPWLFVQSHDIRERAPLGPDNCLTLGPGESFSYQLAVYDLPAPETRTVYDAVEAVYFRWHQPPREGAPLREATADIAGAIARDGWLAGEHSYCGIVLEQPDGSYYYNRIFSISWTNGLAVAEPMLQAALRLGDAAMRAQALDAIEYIAANARNPRTGLLYESWGPEGWHNRGW